MQKLFKSIKQAVSEFSEDRCMSSGAAIAYYSIFALPPLLVIIFMLASYAGVSQQQINAVIRNQLGIPSATTQAAAGGQSDSNEQQSNKETSGDQSASENGEQASKNGESSQGQEAGFGKVAERTQPNEIAGIGTAGRILGLLILAFTATGLFAQLQYALNRAWEVEPDPDRGGVKRFFLKRIFSLGMILVMAFLLFVSMVISTLIDQIIGMAQGASPEMMVKALSITLDNLATLALATLLFAAMFKILPDADMHWRDTFVGAGMTALLFVIGKALIAWYLQRSSLGASWGGAAASLIAVLAWLYYTSLIVLFGAELTQVWAKRYGQGIRPSEGAVRAIEEKRYEREEAT